MIEKGYKYLSPSETPSKTPLEPGECVSIDLHRLLDFYSTQQDSLLRIELTSLVSTEFSAIKMQSVRGGREGVLSRKHAKQKAKRKEGLQWSFSHLR